MRFSTLVILIIVIGVAALIAWKMGYIGKAQQSVEDSFSVHLARGKTHYQKTEYNEAIAELETAMELDPKNPGMPRALRCMGDCYKELRQKEKALEMYHRILDEYPDDPTADEVKKVIIKVEELDYF